MAGDVATYQTGYQLLLPEVFLTMIALAAAYRLSCKIGTGEIVPKEKYSENLSEVFRLYLFFTFFASTGFVTFSLVGFHLKVSNLTSNGDVTTLYAAAMLVDAVAALLVGAFYDRLKKRSGRTKEGLKTLWIIPVASNVIPFFAFQTGGAGTTATLVLVSTGMFFYGVGTHETIMRSAVSDLTQFGKRGSAYGLFSIVYGVGIFAGRTLMGVL